MSDGDRGRALKQAVQQAFVDNADDGEVWDQGLVTGFVLIAEVAAPDGQRYIRTVADTDTTAWFDLGLIEVARLQAQDEIRAAFTAPGGD